MNAYHMILFMLYSKTGKTSCDVRIQGITLTVMSVDKGEVMIGKEPQGESSSVSTVLFLYLGGS